MRWTHRLALAASLLGTGWTKPDARADSAIAILPLTIEGELPALWQEQLVEGLTRGLGRGTRRVVPPLAVLDAVPDAADCKSPECATTIAKRVRAAYLVRPAIVIADRDFMVELELLAGDTGQTIARSAETCEVCAIGEVERLLAEHAAVFHGKIDALTRSPPVVQFESRPAGALIYVDGELVGETPVRRVVQPGRHRVRADLRGHLPLEHALEAAAGTEETLTLELEPIPIQQRLRPWGWGALAFGIPLVTAGATLIGIDERPYRIRCTGEYVDAHGNCRLRYNTLGGGIALTALGAALLVTATALLVVSRKGRRAHPKRLGLWPGQNPTLFGRF